ncbi:MAG: hypothetical protein IPQ04_04540 [Saprospiraceae bacterium]|nr:hypothetical protein [Saprospiraceae bacterium]
MIARAVYCDEWPSELGQYTLTLTSSSPASCGQNNGSLTLEGAKAKAHTDIL